MEALFQGQSYEPGSSGVLSLRTQQFSDLPSVIRVTTHSLGPEHFRSRAVLAAANTAANHYLLDTLTIISQTIQSGPTNVEIYHTHQYYN